MAQTMKAFVTAIGDRKDLTLGHEAVGVVCRLGREVRGFREGDRGRCG